MTSFGFGIGEVISIPYNISNGNNTNGTFTEPAGKLVC